MKRFNFLKTAIQTVVAYGLFCFLITYQLDYPDVQCFLACAPILASGLEKVDAHTVGGVKDTTKTEKTVQTATSSVSFNEKFDTLGSKPLATDKITVDVTSLDAKQMVSDNSRMENPLNKKFKISTSFANDQTVTNASTNVNMFVRLHNKFFSTNFVGFDLLNKKSYVAQFSHMVNA